MTAEQLRELENDLWSAADQLRANSKLTATEYTMPVLGLIFLRQAYNRYLQVKSKIEPSLPIRKGRRMPLTKEMFQEHNALFLPDEAQYDYLVNLPKGVDVGAAIDNAMRLIETEYENLSGVLPKTYTLFEKDLLEALLRTFNSDLLKAATGDMFGKIYEYFLNEFAKKGAQEGGEFFTPMSLVQTIVNFIEPEHGTVLDPACGSAGMFVQTGYFIERLNKDPNKSVTFYGQEKTGTNTNIAKMNMAVHGLEGFIMEGNTFYEDKHDLVGRCDFVMANPPFNVDKVDKDRDVVKKDPRLPFGLPKSDNANYLWIQYFYSYLNSAGRAGFVMASSASDAGHSEKLIREQLIKTGAVDIMVAISNNFFYTRSLPCTLWFYDRSKEQDPERADKILMLDVRKVFRKVTTTINDFSPEQALSLTAIVKAYRGDNMYLENAVRLFVEQYITRLSALRKAFLDFELKYHEVDETMEDFENKDVVNNYRSSHQYDPMWTMSIQDMAPEFIALEANIPLAPLGYAELKDLDHRFSETKALRKESRKNLDHLFKECLNAYAQIGRTYELNKDKGWKTLNIKGLIDELKQLQDLIHQLLHEVEYFHHAAAWLFKRFSDGVYQDVQGLCKVVTQVEVAEKDYSLSPGRYVGVDIGSIDDVDYEERLEQIHLELEQLNAEAIDLIKVIGGNYKEVRG